MNTTTVVVAALVHNRQGQILLGQKRRACSPELIGKWVTPGGKLEHHESLTDCCYREVLDETGIRIVINALLTASDLSTRTEKFVIITFDASPVEGLQAITDKQTDLENVCWVEREEIAHLYNNMTTTTQIAMRAFYGDKAFERFERRQQPAQIDVTKED